jgi:hypothetical protein
VTLVLRVGFAVFVAPLFGCAGNEPEPRIDAVDPAQAYTDRDLRLTLTGAGFLPSFRLDPVSGERVATMDGFSGRLGNEPIWAPLTNFGWVGPTQISASLELEDPDDLGVGPCNVEITDPRGHRAALPAGFLALGRDTPPVVTVTSPEGNDLFAPGSAIHGIVSATDQAPGQMTALTWTYTEPPAVDGSQRDPVTTSCPFRPGPGEIECTFDVIISPGLAPGVTVDLSFLASDDARPPNQTSKDISIVLSQHPSVSGVTPQGGGVAGGINVVISGSGFVAGSRAYFDDIPLIPDGGIVVDPQTITGYTPAHAAGTVPVTVQSRLGLATPNGTFQYQPPPTIESVIPSSGTQGQDTPVTIYGSNFSDTTIIFVGQTWATATALADQSLATVNQIPDHITGVVPGSSGLTRAWVWAFDPFNGWTRLPDPFSWTAP